MQFFQAIETLTQNQKNEGKTELTTGLVVLLDSINIIKKEGRKFFF